MSVPRKLDVAFPEDVMARVRARRNQLHLYQRINPVLTALLVVDMQTAFLEEGSLVGLQTARDIVPTINRLARQVRRTGGRVVWIISTYGPDESDRWPVLLGDVFASDAAEALRVMLSEGANGHALWPLLDRNPQDAVVSKNRSSAFLGSKGKLQRILEEFGVETVLITGTMTSVCCESTAREASMLDFKTIFVMDANGGRSAQEDLATYATFIQSFGDVTTSDDVIDRLEQGMRTFSPSSSLG